MREGRFVQMFCWSGCTALGWFCVAGAWAGEGHSDFEVAQDGTAAHQLLVGGDPKILGGEELIPLAPVNDPFSSLNGWYAAGLPGWEGLEVDEPDEGLFALLLGHGVSLQQVGFDPGFAMFDGAENPILGSNGSTYTFASDPMGGFHEDLLFAAEPDVGLGAMFTAMLRVTDFSGLHADSEVYPLRFVTVPEPGATVLLLCGVLAFARSISFETGEGRSRLTRSSGRVGQPHGLGG